MQVTRFYSCLCFPVFKMEAVIPLACFETVVFFFVPIALHYQISQIFSLFNKSVLIVIFSIIIAIYISGYFFFMFIYSLYFFSV